MDPLMVVLVVLLFLWLTGAFIVPIGGGLIHLLLVIIIVVLVYRLMQNRNVL